MGMPASGMLTDKVQGGKNLLSLWKDILRRAGKGDRTTSRGPECQVKATAGSWELRGGRMWRWLSSTVGS